MNKLYIVLGLFFLNPFTLHASQVKTSPPSLSCPVLKVGDLIDLMAGTHHDLREKGWKQRRIGAITPWMSGTDKDGKIIAAEVNTRNIKALQKKPKVPLFRLTSNPVPLISRNAGYGRLFSMIKQDDAIFENPKMGCVYRFFPTTLDRPGPINGIEFYLLRDLVTKEVHEALSQSEIIKHIEHYKSINIVLPLELTSHAEVDYMNNLQKGSAVYGHAAIKATIPVGLNPHTPISNAAETRLYVANSGKKTVTVIDISQEKKYTVIATIPVGKEPETLVLSADETRLYVLNYFDSSISIIDTTLIGQQGQNPVIATIKIEDTLREPVLNAKGTRLYLSHASGQHVLGIDTTQSGTPIITIFRVGKRPQAPVLTADGKGYVSNSGEKFVSVIDTTQTGVVKKSLKIRVGKNPQTPALSVDESKLYVSNSGDNSVSAIVTALNSVIATIPVGRDPQTPIISANGTRVYVLNYRDMSISVIDTTQNIVIATIKVGRSPQIPVLSPDGAFLYVSNWSDNTVSVIDTKLNSVIATIHVESSPKTPYINSKGTILYVPNEYGHSLSVIDTTKIRRRRSTQPTDNQPQTSQQNFSKAPQTVLG